MASFLPLVCHDSFWQTLIFKRWIKIDVAALLDMLSIHRRWEDTLSAPCLMSELASTIRSLTERHWRITNRQLLLINVRWLHEILVVREKYDRFHRYVHLCLVQKSVMIFHTGAVEPSRVFDFGKLSTVLDSAAKVQENKSCSRRSIKNVRFSIRRFYFRVSSLSLENVISCAVILSCFSFLEAQLFQIFFPPNI